MSGCYECCQGPGSRRELWDRLCVICRKITRAFTCHGYMTVVINPRVRVPRRTATSRWAQFLKKYSQFSATKAETVEEFKAHLLHEDDEKRAVGAPVIYAGNRLRQKQYLSRRSSTR